MIKFPMGCFAKIENDILINLQKLKNKIKSFTHYQDVKSIKELQCVSRVSLEE